MYQHLQRPTAFPHEELIINASNSFPSKESIKFLLPEIQNFIRKESEGREKFKKRNIIYCVPDSQKEEVKQCIICKSDCYFSGVMCVCSPSRFFLFFSFLILFFLHFLLKNRITCLNHFENLCGCDSSSKYLSMRFTLSFLKSIESNLLNRLELFENSKSVKLNQITKKRKNTSPKNKIPKKKLHKLAKTGGMINFISPN